MIRFFTYEQYHAKENIGSTKIRVHNLLKHWPEAGLYNFGQNPDVLIFQKVYATLDYKFPINFQGIKILDICDPDWKDSPDIFIKETLDAMDYVVTSSQPLADYLQQMTETPCSLIKDRFDLEDFPPPKKHFSEAKTVVWFGYAHNAETIRFAIPSLENRKLNLLIIANEDPAAWRWATKPEAYKKFYKFIKYSDDQTVRKQLQEADIAVLTIGSRPFDKFKSENKTIIAKLCGLPVIRDADELDKMMSGPAREKYIESVYNKLKADYDVRKSVEEYKVLINEIKANRR